MRHNTSRNADDILARQRRRRKWLKIVGALSCVVVFCTTYALILPAITMEKKTACALEEHTHTESCYTQVEAVPKTVPICTMESLAIHRHSDGCLDENGGLCCGEADFVVHTHDARCYDENGQLWCPILEKEAHTHDAGCYTQADPHVHGDGCYQKERGELTCTLSIEPVHTHGEGCYAPEKKLVCALTEGEGHLHGEGCRDESGALVCTQEESEGHQHGESCYESVLTCTESTEPAHVHTDECYEWKDTLICTQPTGPAEPALTCKKEEIRLHEHTREDCFETDENGSPYLTCKQTRILEHVHTDACFQTVSEPVDPQALTCRLEESESHRHSALCYGAWKLSCGLEEHTHSAECADTPEYTPLAEAPAADATPLTLDSYISGATLSYRVSPDTEFHPVDKNTPLPGNAELRLEISYKDIHVNDLRNAGLQVTYTLPQILRVQTGSGPILDNNKERMGTMDVTAEDRLVTLTFDETWLNKHHGTEDHDQISGTFYVDSGIDLSQADTNPLGQITVGNVTIDLALESDIIAKYADVTLQKECAPKAIHDDSGDYLEYTLTVTTGQDGAPNVVVKDAFQDQSQILGYVGISPGISATESVAGPVDTGVSAGQAVPVSMDGDTQNMMWNIGNMAANETRALTYRVKMKEGYLGGKVPNNPVVNTAEIFCGEHPRGDATGTFTPTVDTDMRKVASHFTPDPDGSGGGTIEYTVWIHAMDTNNYTLTDVKIWDALDGSIGNNNATDSKLLPHLSFVEDSFRLYQGGDKNQSGASGLTPEGGIAVPPVFQNNKDETPNRHFITCDVGTLAPGESKTLTYTLRVEPGVFPAAGNEAPSIHNRAQIHAGDTAKGNEDSLESYNATLKINKKEWSSKQSGKKQENATTVSIPSTDMVYAADGSPVENPPKEFTAPAGIYQYQVSVNKAGDWDVSNASLKDQLLNGYSKFVGYVRVEAYDVDASGSRTLAKTVWLSVDGLTEFTFTPSSVGLTKKQAYELTYYTSVTIPAGAPQVNVENKFTMSGTVGIGTQIYEMEGAYVTASNIVQGENHFSVSKHSWYYEPAKVETGEYANGAIYWYIQVDGNVIPANTYLRDTTTYNKQFMYDSSLVGLYTGNLGDGSVASYDDLEALLAFTELRFLDKSYYDDPQFSSHDIGGNRLCPIMTVRLKKDVQLNEGESLFLIVKIEPHVNPAGHPATDNWNYHNKVESSYDGTHWVEWNEDSMAIYGANGISKTLEKVSSWNGTTETVVTPAGGATDVTALTGLESGTYVSWKVQLNYPGRLHGSYYVEEIIPDGMELAYVQCTGVGAGYKAAPSCAQKSPGEGWTEHQREGVIPTYYYTNGQTARWYVDNLQTGGNNHTVDFRVVCRVTDTDVLLGGTQKEFQNQVNLCREGGKIIDSSSSPVSIQTHSLSKKGIYTQEEPTKFPFEITLNPLGEDLVPGSETLSLVDTLSDTLKLDLSSIQVKETGTDTAVTDWGSAVDGQTLTLTLPDQKALTVTYSALINARPGDTISISNNAHWEGYATPSSGGVKNDNFEFAIQGSAGTSEYPGIQITKRDANHLSTVLEGAEFTLKKAVEQNGEIIELDETVWSGTTDANGSLSFSTADGKTMNYNTIYCLRETKAPVGYVLDDAPHYFVVAQKKAGSDSYPDSLKNLPSNVHVHYLSSEYPYDALNQKGRITVQKKFADAGGNDYPPVAGTYTFGLYNTVDASSGMPTGDPVKTASITYAVTDTAYKEVVFRDLDLDRSYYVFELDADGKPIAQGGPLSDLFEVTYDYPGDAASTSITLTATNGAQTVTVTNVIYTPELPETGGVGDTAFYVIGPILLAGAAVLLLKKKRLGAGT